MATNATNALTTTSQAVTAAQRPAPRTIKELLQGEEIRRQVGAALPRHLKPERFLRVAINATMRQPELLKCTRESFFRCLLDLSSYGLEPDGRRAHLIPFRNNKTNTMEVQLIIDYKGLAELVRRSGDVSYIHADTVYEKDEFDFAYGSNAFLKHRPNLEDRGERVAAVYSFVKLKDGSEDFIVMSRAEIEKVRKRSRAANAGPWVTDWGEMAKKTAFRRHSKWLPLSPEIRDLVERDDEITGVEMPDIERTTITLDAVQPSEDENRGHDATQPPPMPAQEQPEAADQPLTDEENRALDRKLAEEDAARETATAKAPRSTRPSGSEVRQKQL